MKPSNSKWWADQEYTTTLSTAKWQQSAVWAWSWANKLDKLKLSSQIEAIQPIERWFDWKSRHMPLWEAWSNRKKWTVTNGPPFILLAETVLEKLLRSVFIPLFHFLYQLINCKLTKRSTLAKQLGSFQIKHPNWYNRLSIQQLYSRVKLKRSFLISVAT